MWKFGRKMDESEISWISDELSSETEGKKEQEMICIPMKYSKYFAFTSIANQ